MTKGVSCPKSSPLFEMNERTWPSKIRKAHIFENSWHFVDSLQSVLWKMTNPCDFMHDLKIQRFSIIIFKPDYMTYCQ